MNTTILRSKTKRFDKNKDGKLCEEEKKAAADKKAAPDKKKVSFAQFCKELEYRRAAVYYRSKHLFNKISPKMNAQNERIFFDYLTENNLLLTY